MNRYTYTIQAAHTHTLLCTGMDFVGQQTAEMHLVIAIPDFKLTCSISFYVSNPMIVRVYGKMFLTISHASFQQMFLKFHCRTSNLTAN